MASPAAPAQARQTIETGRLSEDHSRLPRVRQCLHGGSFLSPAGFLGSDRQIRRRRPIRNVRSDTAHSPAGDATGALTREDVLQSCASQSHRCHRPLLNPRSRQL